MKRITALLFFTFLFISSITANHHLPPVPSLEIVNVERSECDTLDLFFVDIVIEHDSINSPGFTIQGNGVVYDTFEYGKDFYTVGPIEGDCITTYEFGVIDLLDPSCSDFWEFDEPVCCSPCHIVADDIINLDCDSTGYREVEFKVVTENEGQDGFDLLYWGIFIEHFDYGINTYTVSVPGDGTNHRLTVRDTQFPDCADLFLAKPDDCANAPECHFNLSQNEVLTVGPCTSDSTFNLIINEIPYEGEEDSIIVNFHSMWQITIAVKDLPYTLENLSVDNGEYELSFHEPGNIFCDFHTVFETPDCSGFNDCRIYDVIGELHMCNDTSNLVFVDIAFEVTNPVSDSFEIRGNGVSYGVFAYGEPFYTVGPIEANCNQNYEFIVIDRDVPDCRGEFFFTTPPCCEPDECNIFDLVVDPGACTGDGEFVLYIDFEYEGVTNDFFDVFSDGNYVGTYAYNDLPLEIINFPAADGTMNLITICDNDNPDCCLTEDFTGPDCSENDCEIFEINTDPVECVGDGFYSLWLNFEHTGTSADSFEVYSQGQLIGTYAFDDLPVFIEEFPEREVEYDIITICEQDNEDCCTTHEFIGLDCFEECELYDVNVDPDNCTGDGVYSLYLNFQHQGADNDFFEVFSEGVFIGTYAFADLPVFIEEFPERDAPQDIITICINDNPNCCVTHEFDGLDCQVGDCVISEVFAEAYECNEDGQIYFDLIFDYENEGNEGFTIQGNGMNYGNFDYGEPFYTLGPLPGDCSTIYEFVVIDNQFIDCEAFYAFDEPICCEEELCLITDIAIDLEECTGDGVYSMWLNFEHQNVTNDFFDVFSNGVLIGNYAYEDLPVFIEEFPERDAEYDIITICDNDNPDCCASHEFIGLDCEEGACAIFDIIVEPIECTGDGVYSIELDFEHQNTTNDFFDVYSNGVLVGFYAYADLPIIIPNFPERDAEYDIIQICDNDNPNCCGVLEFIGLDCEEDSLCAIFEIEVDPLECTGDGEYSLVLNFEYQNVTNDFFDVFSNGEFIGFYAYADLPVTIEHFPERDAEYDLIQICDNDNPNCCGVHEFIGLDCEEGSEECNISEIVVDPIDCTGDGVYSLFLNFEYEHVTNDFFDVYSNGVLVGFYAYADLPITIDAFPERDAEYDIITICDNDNPDCCQSHEFIGLDCSDNDDCSITGLFAEAGECNEDGFFFLDFEFDYDNVGNMGFVVRGNGVIYDTFEYGETFYTIGPLEADCQTIYELVVIDIEFDDCQTGFAFEEAICCDDGSCQISGLEAEVYNCDTIGDLVFVDLWFNVENPDANGFTVAGNGIVYDTFEYGEPFYTVGPIEADCETIYEFVVIDLENPDCSDDLSFDEPLCCEDPEVCSIDSLVILETDCIDDVYIIVLNLDYSFTGELGFDLYIDSSFHSFHMYENLPITIEVPKNDYPDPFIITVCDNDSETCCLSIIYDFDMIDAIDRIPDDEVSVVITQNELSVSMDDYNNKTLSIFSVDGRLTHQRTFVDNANIETGEWHSGLYILYIESASGYYSQKLMIIN